jgi:peptide/nickel transport system substrate-binding protein
VRETPDGERLSLLFQTSTNPVRQDFQALIKQWWEEIGVEVELRNVDPAVYFGGDPASPDTIEKFYADLGDVCRQLRGDGPDRLPRGLHLRQDPVARDPVAGAEHHPPVRRDLRGDADGVPGHRRRGGAEPPGAGAELVPTLENKFIIGIVDRGRVSAHSNTLEGVKLNTWDSELWNAADWTRADQ